MTATMAMIATGKTIPVRRMMLRFRRELLPPVRCRDKAILSAGVPPRRTQVLLADNDARKTGDLPGIPARRPPGGLPLRLKAHHVTVNTGVSTSDTRKTVGGCR